MDKTLGCDISKWQGVVDFEKMRAAGAQFIFVRASQALASDPAFAENWKRARQAGLLRGAYHYLDWTKSIGDQARFFSSLLMDDPGELPPVLDYEERHGAPKREIAWSSATAFLRMVEAALAKKPMLYTGIGYMADFGPQTADLQPWPLWVAHWGVQEPKLPRGWQTWEFWQFTDRGDGRKFGCQSAQVDLNYFNGSVEQLRTRCTRYGMQTEPGNGQNDKVAEIVADLKRVIERLEKL